MQHTILTIEIDGYYSLNASQAICIEDAIAAILQCGEENVHVADADIQEL